MLSYPAVMQQLESEPHCSSQEHATPSATSPGVYTNDMEIVLLGIKPYKPPRDHSRDSQQEPPSPPHANLRELQGSPAVVCFFLLYKKQSDHSHNLYYLDIHACTHTQWKTRTIETTTSRHFLVTISERHNNPNTVRQHRILMRTWDLYCGCGPVHTSTSAKNGAINNVLGQPKIRRVPCYNCLHGRISKKGTPSTHGHPTLSAQPESPRQSNLSNYGLRKYGVLTG